MVEGARIAGWRRIVARWAWLLTLCVVLTSGAQAADVFDVSGLVRVLPVAPLVGDGQTSAELHVLLRTASGAPVTGGKLRATVSQGKADDVVELGDGLYRVVVTPPVVKAPTTLHVSVKGKVDTLGPIEAVRDVTVLPAATGRISVTTSVPSLVLRQDPETTLTITVPDTAGVPPTVDDLLIRASSGEVTGVVAIGGGRFAGKYLAPALNSPHLAILTVVDRRNPGSVWGSATVALMGKVDYPTTAPAGSMVMLRVQGREFGPVTSNESGRASIPVIVPPGVATARQITSDGANVKETDLDLRVPEAQRLALFGLPRSVPADSRLGVPVRVVVRKPDGAPDLDADVQLSATAGKVSRPIAVGDGVYSARYTPPDGRIRLEATIQASLPGSSISDGVQLVLIPAMPASLTLSTEPTELSAAGTGLKVFASLAGADGAGLPDRDLRVRAAGATLQGPVVDLKGGDYRVDLVADQGTDVFVRTVALNPASDNALRHVVLLPSRPSVDPGANVAITVVTTDEFGYPVPSVPVSLSVDEGGGTLPTLVTTDSAGLAELVYTAGRAPGLAILTARAADVTGTVGFYQAPLTDAAMLPASGSAVDRSVLNAVAATTGAVYVEREGGADAPIGVAAAAAGGAVASLSVASSPDVGAPGGSVTLAVRAVDAAGLPSEGVALEYFATGGARVRDAVELGGGQYQAVLEIPVDATETVKVNVMADGTVAGGVEVALAPDAVRVAAVPDAVAPADEVATTEVPADDGMPDRPWLRWRFSFLVGTYQYEQTPSATPGGVLDAPLGWGGARGGAPIPMGLDTQLRLFIPQVPYLGLDAQFRYSRYAVSSDAFSADAVDNLFFASADVVGRIPIRAGRSVIHLGLKAGFRFDDFVTFHGCAASGCSVTYQPLRLPGLDAGLELGAEFGPVYLVASSEAGFAYARVPYAVNADLNLGWNFVKNAFLDVGFAYVKRQTELEGADSGVVRATIDDQQIMGTVGVGFSL